MLDAMNVLVVEDMPDVRVILRAFLGMRPDMNVVAEAPDGLVGIRLAQDLHPDVILLDRQMAILDGDSALPMLREAAPEAAIIVYSSFVSDPLERVELLSQGADQVVDKADRFDYLEAAIRAAVASRTT